MEYKEKILAEIERLANFATGYYTDNIASGYKICCKDITAFINSIPEESVSEDLEEAALMHFKDVMEYEVKSGLKMANITSFKAGAKWEAEQMIEKAIDAHCFGFQGAALFSFRLPASNYLVGSKVKVIVIKED